MERGMDASKLQMVKKALWDMVKPDDKDWQFNFSTEMTDYNRILQRITSVPNWKEDMDLVYLFVVMRERKHTYFAEFYFEEDLVIVPDLLYNSQKPNTQGLSEQQRNLTMLVHNVLTQNRNFHVKAVYNQVYEQFYAIQDWKHNPVLAELFEKISSAEKYLTQWLIPRAPEAEEKYNREVTKEIEKTVIKIQSMMKEGYLAESDLKSRYYAIHNCTNWWRNEKLRTWNAIVVSEIRIHRLRDQGKWASRIVHEQPRNNKRLLQRMWDKVWPSNKSQKPASQN